MLLALFVLCAAAVPSSMGQKLHELMSSEEVAQVFQTTHESVPEYEVVQFDVPSRKKREVGKPEELIATAFGNNIKLWLKPIEGVLIGEDAQVLVARTRPWGIDYIEYRRAMSRIGRIVEDAARKATLITGINANGQRSYNGYIGAHNLVVRSLPDPISNDLVKNSSAHNSESFGDSKSAYHVVFKREVKDELFDRYVLAEHRATNFESMPATGVFKVPSVVYPECMIVVDYATYKMHGNVDNLLTYLVAFWNGVDLLYRSLEQPKIRFNIRRIVIALDDYATPYLYQHKFSPSILDSHEALTAAGKYFYSIQDMFPRDSYDLAVIMTNMVMGDEKRKPVVLGVAPLGGMCKVLDDQHSVWSMILMRDNGEFSGVPTTAHEIAHLFNSTHDTEDDCLAQRGFIMSPTAEITKNSHDFSECTIMAVDKFLKANGGFCLYNKPQVWNPMSREYLPGIDMDRNEQCHQLGYGDSCYEVSSDFLPCTNVYCKDKLDSNGCWRNGKYSPPDGAYCAEGKMCLHGQCVAV